MKLIKMLVAGCAFFAVSAYAVDPVKTDTTCAQLAEKYQATEEAKKRFADLLGSCEGVYDVDGHLYVRSQAVIRSKSGDKFRLYLPATDHTFEVTAQPDGVVWVGSRKMRARDMNRGDEIGIYLSVDKFAEGKTEEVHFPTPDESQETIETVPVEEVAALPTTG
jgi:hypothetical protein